LRIPPGAGLATPWGLASWFETAGFELLRIGVYGNAKYMHSLADDVVRKDMIKCSSFLLCFYDVLSRQTPVHLVRLSSQRAEVMESVCSGHENDFRVCL
jgi:hypothetical protein